MTPRCQFVSLILLLTAARLVAAERYTAQFEDGVRVEEAEIRTWHDAEASPTLGGKLLFAPENPARWIIDRQQPPGPPAGAFVEFAGGDRLTGLVVGTRTGPDDQRPPQLLVKLASDWHDPDNKHPSELRVSTEWVQRIVWQRNGSEAYRPGTAVLLNGGELAFRSLRWDKDRLRLLTADGVRDFAWDGLAELHLPKRDAWNSYLDQLAVLNPSGTARMIQLETSDGSCCTTSQERFRPRHWGNGQKPDTWYQHIQPAWSLDPLWVRFRQVRTWRFWQPDCVPLTMIAPVRVEQRAVFGSGWSWQINRSVRKTPLQSAQWEFSRGFGVQASTDLRFDYPLLARAIRTQASLDRSSANGGCVKLSILDGAANPLFQADHVIGSTRLVDTGWLNLPQVDSGPRQIVLQADMDHAQRPADADPFDIRDAVNWYEPEIRLDRELLQAELARRGRRP